MPRAAERLQAPDLRGTQARGDRRARSPGDIVVLSGIENVHIGDTICTRELPKALQAHHRRRADGLHALLRQHLAPLRAGRQERPVRASSSSGCARKPSSNVSIQVEEVEGRRRLRRQGARRVPAGHPHRDAAAGGLRALRRAGPR
ncbi:MAG: hypothetical protein MZU91_14305 [Desulfosudis oleivorans]|nr:hypothetical protein [Desulfosudis oleivorans]